MRAKIWTALFVLAVAILIGCGGGGGGETTVSTTASGGTTSTAGGTGTTTGTMLSDAARNVIIANALTAYGTVPANNGICDPNALLAAIKKVSGLTKLVVGQDGSVNGQFSDGVAATFFNNRPFDPPTTTSSKPRVTSDSPSTGSVQLLDSLDPIFVGSIVADDGAMFSENGYPGTVTTLATVEAYRAIGGKPMSCLSMAGHGGVAQNGLIGGLAGFGVWTATSTGPSATGASYSADLADGSLGIGFAYSTHVGNGLAAHYMLLPHFMTKYNWKFAKNSYVTLGCCWGGSPLAVNFRTALFNLGASVVMGWTQVTQSNWDYSNNSYMFDRTIGANQYFPTTPAHRPFPWSVIYTAMQTVTGSTHHVYNGYSSDWVWFTAPGSDQNHGFQLFNPSLLPVSLQNSKDGMSYTATLDGSNFGVPGGAEPTFTMGGKSYSSSLNSSGVPTFTLPISSCAGPLTATVIGPDSEKLISNPRNISVWAGTITTTTNAFGNEPGEASVVGTLSVHFRDDIQSTYKTPYDPKPTAPTPTSEIGISGFTISNSANDTMSVVASGTATTKNIAPNGDLLSTQTDTYSGSQSQQLFGGFNGVTLGVPPAAGGAGYMQVFEDTKQTMTDTGVLTIPMQGSTTTNGNLNDAFTSEVFTGNNGNQWFQIKTDSNYNIVTDTLTVTTDGRPRYILDLGTLSCTYPPTTTTAR